MATSTRPRFASYEDYQAFERASEEQKHEFVDGEVFAMAGGKGPHNQLGAQITAALVTALRDQPCTVYSSDMRVRTPRNRAHYPDVSALCGKPLFSDDTRDELLNPTLLVEVLSDSTEGYDRGKKFESYVTIDSLREYVLVASDHVHIDHFVRDREGWHLRQYEAGQRIKLASLPCELDVDEVYRRVFDVAGG
jgi:Uma2 family endonuclease